MTQFGPADTLHRLVKLALDSGTSLSREEAEATFRTYRLAFSIGLKSADDPGNQAALLTGVALGRRSFLGGVTVSGQLDVPLRVPLALGDTLGSAVLALGGSIAEPGPEVPLISIGKCGNSPSSGFHVRTEFSGWRGGILPAQSDRTLAGGPAIPLAAMLSASLAVNEAFLAIRGEGGAVGHRSVGLSLWDPSPETDWLIEAEDEPELRFLPSKLWLIGLGNLGQAYLWGLGLLPYGDPGKVALVLQDIDKIVPSNVSTSILTEASLVGQWKTRAMATWAEQRGFSASIQERTFDGSFHRNPGEPAIALCGLDNALGRQALDRVGFDLVIEAGLGRGHRDFRNIRLHTLPAKRSAAEIWREEPRVEAILEQAAYRKMLGDGDLDRCGTTLLAGKAVGAPFVGTSAACLVLAEVLRFLHGGPLHSLEDVDLQYLEYRTVVKRQGGIACVNPGFVAACTK